MNINASIIDQRVDALAEQIGDQAQYELGINDPVRLKSLTFVFLCVQTVLDLDANEAFNCLTEGGGDFGVDALHISEEHDGEFGVTLFQAKYRSKLDAQANFPETGVERLINAIRYLFDPSSHIEHINDRLRAKVEEVRSLIRDGYIPQVRAIACNNGLQWTEAAQEAIDRTGFESQVTWEHINHDALVNLLLATKPVNDTLQLKGKAIVEDMNFSRVLVGRMSVRDIASLIERHGQRLLQRNIRRYLGLHGNRVNESIKETLQGPDEGNFYFYNNGITLTCDKFAYNALQGSDYQVKVENLQIINGGQTSMTIFKTLSQPPMLDENLTASVLIRLYQLPTDNEDLVQQITYATNSQNPVDLRDLKANDSKQRQLELDMQQLGYHYRRKRSDQQTGRNDITSGVAAEAVLSVWRERPHQARFFAREHFGKLYDLIFTESLTGAQVVAAVLLYRMAENRRRRPKTDDPLFVRYASCFVAMQMGKRLLRDLGVRADGISHQNFPTVEALIDTRGEAYLNEALDDIQKAVDELYGGREVSLQQLSATFRRGDLIEILKGMDP